MNKTHVKSGLFVVLIALVAVSTKSMLEAGISADSLGAGRSTFTVSVRDNLNLGVPDLSVSVQAQDGSSRELTEVNTDGNYVFRGRAGTYTFTAIAPNYVTETKTESAKLNETKAVEIYLSPEL